MANWAKRYFLDSINAWKAGVDARKQNKPLKDCPYRLRWWQRGQVSFARRLWLEGWEHEDKREDT